MFERCDLDKKIDKKAFEKMIPDLRENLGRLQRACRDQGIPVVIVIEGWNASGITHVTGEIVRAIDPRGFDLHATGKPTDIEQAHHLLWRFFIKTPEKGRIAIFARSWYSRALAEELSGIDLKQSVRNSTSSIRVFERQLGDDGVVLLKFFLHISKEEQRKRLLDREKDKLTSWMITKGDWDFHNQYDLYRPVIEQFIEETDTPYASWKIVEAIDSDYATITVLTAITRALQRRLDGKDMPKPNYDKNGENSKKKNTGINPDPDISISKAEYTPLLKEYQDKVREAQYLLYKRKIPLIIVYEGWDAAGKGGNILRLIGNMNPRGYEVVPVSCPNDYELAHHYLWRFYMRFPKSGHITVFDRSWYGRVLVERVENYCRDDEWKRAYREINETEEIFREYGGGIIKFWLEIDKDEQLKRFRQREEDSNKQWKMTGDDWRNREQWDQYREAREDMINKTNTSYAPWTIIESNDKYHSRLKALKTVIDYIGELL
ncbi:MAG TPA: polyphosphate:AMP phosphotransferase [Methanoregulaceae archaeon]|nr:polyphosphate:AMP phosphotransferase [Methanoregulaceae archaeon]